MRRSATPRSDTASSQRLSLPGDKPLGILQRIARGDASAVQDCIDAYGPLVGALVRRLCPSAAESDDVVQEIFIDLWKSAGRFEPATAPEAVFVAVIARRRLLDLRRRLLRRGESHELSVELATTETSLEEQAEVRDEADRARRALVELQPEQRRVLQLAVLHGLSHQEISAATGLPLGTVKTHARRGLLRVRELLSRTPAAAAAAGRVTP
jgi:RNA polymerase sigma factor (sigma-70 family)